MCVRAPARTPIYLCVYLSMHSNVIEELLKNSMNYGIQNYNDLFSIRLKYAMHFLASCMALLGYLMLTTKACFP